MSGGAEHEHEYEHEPVMVEEVLEGLQPERGGTYLDGTLGGGGHAAALLARSSSARVLGIDRDPDAIEAATERTKRYEDRIRIVRGDFRNVPDLIGGEIGKQGLAGALLDLGVSSHQIDTTARGFSFRPSTPLLMRMGGTTGGRRPAADLLNEASEAELGRIFREYSEERRWRRLARAVVRRRREDPLRTSDDLLDVMREALGHVKPRDRARIFQGVRIAVNDELGALEEGLPRIRELLAPDGRFVAIAYHSLEDRIVKNAFRDWSRECVCPPELPVCRCRGRALGRRVVRGPLRPSEAEVAANPRSRSARLRVWEKA